MSMPLPVPQPTVLFGLPGIMRHDPDFLPGYVANYIRGRRRLFLAPDR